MKTIVNRTPVSSKLWILSTGIFLLVAGYQFYVLQLSKKQLKGELFRKSNELVYEMAGKLGTSLWLHQITFAESQLRELETKTDVAFLSLTDSTFLELYGFRSEAFDSLIFNFKTHPEHWQDADAYFLFKHPVMFDGQSQGHLIAGFTREWLNQKLAEKERELLIASGLLALFLILLTAFLANGISKPLAQATELIENYRSETAGGDLLVSVKGNGETARLVRALGSLTADMNGKLQSSASDLAFLETFFTANPMAMIVANEDGEIERVNRNAALLFQSDERTLTKKSMIDLIGANDFFAIKKQLEPPQKHLFGYTSLAVTAEDERKALELNIIRVENEHHTATSYVFTIINITGKTGVQSPARSEKMESLAVMVGGIAHEFNNILGIISPNLDLIQRGIQDSAMLAKRLPVVKESVDRAISFTRRLMRFSKNQQLNLQALSINEIVLRLAKVFQKALGKKYQIVTSLETALPDVYVDEMRISQVLMNLTVNARDAMPKGGRIDIRTSIQEFVPEETAGAEKKEYVQLTVSDNGPGIPDDVLYKIFDPFFTTRGIGKNVGLGLSEVYGIVKSHHGYITVEAVRNGGTTFHIYLSPYQAKPAARNATQDRTPLNTSRKPVISGADIVVVNDEKQMTEKYE